MRELRTTLKQNNGISIMIKLTTVGRVVGRGSMEGLDKGVNVGMKIDTIIRALASEPPKTFIWNSAKDRKNVIRSEVTTFPRISIDLSVTTS
jgi:hypothetical protein